MIYRGLSLPHIRTNRQNYWKGGDEKEEIIRVMISN